MRHSAFGPIDIPVDFWIHPDVIGALARRDMRELFGLLRERTGVSQTRLGTAVGMAQGRISDIMHGKHQNTTVRKLNEIADGLCMPAHARAALGLPEDAIVKTEYPATTDLAVAAMTGLLRADESKSETLLSAAPDPALWNAAALAWLVGEPDEQLSGTDSGRAVGQSDVARVRASTALFGDLDNRFGGAHARRSLIHFLDRDAVALLAGRYAEQTGRELFAAVARASLLAAWTSYDCGLHGLAQRYFVHALRLAQAADARQLACHIMGGMSHQATYLGRTAEAANLARAAHDGLRDMATPALTARFRAMEARALARAGDRRGCQVALTAAERAFRTPEPDRDPDFIGYFNEAELTAEIAHCLLDLGDSREAASHAANATPSDGQYARSDFFITIVHADALADDDEPGRACRTALNALQLGEALTSARCVTYVREFRKRLIRFGDSTELRDFTRQAERHALWVKAASNPIKTAASHGGRHRDADS
jgi:transcriptional regulator with XRE-family HTH domain